ncbi:MAG: glutathione S-transferase N-terminal domain-containing protein [Proteobacteria bacterium]|nr:glutathione S-transferase N-terminal domain-containing protein [Pseudomonadota bacterium]
MIDVYSWPTPNGHKIHIMLEEVGLPYRAIPVNIGAGEQFRPEFLAISPNNRIPAIVDHEGPGGGPYSLFESGAILIYLAEKTGKLLPLDARGRFDAIQWLMFQMGNVGPMFGQANHFRGYAKERIAYAISRYTNEANRLYNVLDRRLKESAYVAGPAYTIADIAIYPWMRAPERRGVNEDEYPNVKRWRTEIDARPAVQRGCQVLAEHTRKGPITDAEREVMFGKTQYQRR